MGKMTEIVNGTSIPSYITPLFWQHGENEHILREEIKQMHENGINSFVIESRPHPDFLGDMWWRDLDILLDEARKRSMKVWLFDDSSYPSGYAAGRIRDLHPEYLKVYLAEKHVDVIGPLKGSSFLIQAWLDEGDELIGVIAAKRIDGVDVIDADTLIDVSRQVHKGILYWDVPEGDWRVFILIRTRNGGEEHTKDYLNPLQQEAVGAFIHHVHEEHYRRYASDFGQTIVGFFTDEPRFGNVASYDGSLGQKQMEFPYGGIKGPSGYSQFVLPYADSLIAELDAEWEDNVSYKLYLPLLWYEGGERTHSVRFTYMNVVSRLYAENYTQQIGDWCRTHNVKLIGHVVEDNGAHARLGFGSGHFFRAIKGQDYSGLDVVYQIWPEYTSGRFTTPFGYLNTEFFYWGMTKMATSAAHLDPKKQGVTICEAFGAYGWQEGLKLMKWITDHLCVRGVNFLVPHAFSPKFPDLDCPPHFYARGENPQWRYFNVWSTYANRVCHLLSGGRHVAPIAVIYHAEAEWSGSYQPFEEIVKTLALHQIDCDVIPIDTFVNEEEYQILKGKFQVNEEQYRAIVVPYAERLPEAFIKCLMKLQDNGIHVLFIRDYPTASSTNTKPHDFNQLLAKLKQGNYANAIALDELVPRIRTLGYYDVEVKTYEEALRYYHYIQNAESLFFFTNESRQKTVQTHVRLRAEGVPLAYDAMNNQVHALHYTFDGEFTIICLKLAPYDSVFIVFLEDGLGNYEFYPHETSSTTDINSFLELPDNWITSKAEAKQYPDFELEEKIHGLGNISLPEILPDFSGTIKYETTFEFERSQSVSKVILDLGEVYEIADVWMNDIHLGVRICSPYTFEAVKQLKDGINSLRIEVTNTLVRKMPSAFDRSMPQEPSGLIGPVRIYPIR
ncbi:glycosyl hydrolase [Cohnella silvisoli]|uniref:Glycosyl hydrolase n=1 Tax=Cohnella silvisoli TaxID=2873699 RepID=A0ABV1KUI8_9BACL|nr:glycosyl hydrolase [Cohnella silvisoli]MCD9021488.1 hypothetical protein [Cohnella silvisoli]